MSVQDVESNQTETTETPKRKSSRKSRGRKSTSRKRASANRSSQASARRSSSRSRASSGSRTSSADRMLRQGKRVINRAYNFAEEARRAMPRMDLRLPRRSDFDALTAANPLVIGAIGLGLGVVLGTLMPQRASDRLSSLAQMGYSSRSSSRRGRSRRGGSKD